MGQKTVKTQENSRLRISGEVIELSHPKVITSRLLNSSCLFRLVKGEESHQDVNSSNMGNRNVAQRGQQDMHPDQVICQPCDTEAQDDHQASFTSCDENEEHKSSPPPSPEKQGMDSVVRTRSGSMADSLLDQLPKIMNKSTKSGINKVEVTTRPGAITLLHRRSCSACMPSDRSLSHSYEERGGGGQRSCRRAAGVRVGLRAGV